MSPFQILGVSESVSTDELKRAYRKLVVKYHPDRYNGDGSKFILINDAYKKALELINNRSKKTFLRHKDLLNFYITNS